MVYHECMIGKIKNEIKEILKSVGVTGEIELTTPPNIEMGDLAYGCFGLAKELGKKPNEVAKDLESRIMNLESRIIDKVKAVGPYINFTLKGSEVAKLVFDEVDENFGESKTGKGKKVLVEFGCPNPLKVFHLGHLKNLITGESVARILDNAGYKTVRINYQGDVGMHIAKAIYGLQTTDYRLQTKFDESLTERVKLLGNAYTEGAKAFEDEDKKKEIIEINRKVYEKDREIQDIYKTAVAWSLEYFDEIYKKLGTRFDNLYMESEVYEPATKIVHDNIKKGIFKESQGAIIYEGSKYGLHDRVFINSEGFPTYEAKDLGLAEIHFKDHKPDRIVHVVGREQAEYFKVVFKAIEEIWPDRAGVEYHLPGGFLQLKGKIKMSSRTGQVISGDELLHNVETRVREIMSKNKKSVDEEILRKVTDSVLTYAMLKNSVSQDVSFDMEESVSASGDSGPYLLYIVARIKSILKKARKQESKKTRKQKNNIIIGQSEKKLLLSLANYPEIALEAAEKLDPSLIAKYLFGLAQTFNTFYHECPVLKAEDMVVKEFRLALIEKIERVMTSGLELLGIETVEEM
jgi:arginyl-tRNA synthetase